MIGDTSGLIDEIAHPIYRSKDGVVYGIIDAISHQLTVVFNMFNLVTASVHAQEAIGQDLDSLARLLNIYRKDETDDQFRTRLLSHVNTYEKNTIDAVEDFVEALIGYRPDVKEYFDQNSAEAQIMMERYGLPHTFGTFVIELPWNYGHYEDLVQTKLETGNIKAAGIRAFVEVVKKFVLQLAEGIIADDFQTIQGSVVLPPELIPGHGTVGNGFDNVPGFDTIKFDATVSGIRDGFMSFYGDYLKELSETFATPDDLMAVVFLESFSGPFQDDFGYPKLGRYEEDTLPTPTVIFWGWIEIAIDDPINDKITVIDSPLTGDMDSDFPESISSQDSLEGGEIEYDDESTFPTPTLIFWGWINIGIDDPANDKITAVDALTGDADSNFPESISTDGIDSLEGGEIEYDEEDTFPIPILTFWVKVGIDDPTNDKIVVVDLSIGGIIGDFPETISSQDSLEGGEIERVTAWADGPVSLAETDFDSDLVTVGWRCGESHAKFGTIKFGGVMA